MSSFPHETFAQLLTEVNEYLINESSKSTLTEADQKCLQEFSKGLSLSSNRAQRLHTRLPLTFPKNPNISKNLIVWFKAQDEKVQNSGNQVADGREPVRPEASASESNRAQEVPRASQPEGSNTGVRNDKNVTVTENNQTMSEPQSTQLPLSRPKRSLEVHSPPEPSSKRSKQSTSLPALMTFHIDRLLELVNRREELSDAVKLLKDSLKVVKIIGNIRMTLWHLDYLRKMCPNDAAILEAVDFVTECLEVRDELELD
ncbi:hypothetical protein JVU11DRAFT_10863 [Chiua virens]|nr:hypothetical protein JVU11DRAFT_10863 [Chiua virens]